MGGVGDGMASGPGQGLLLCAFCPHPYAMKRHSRAIQPSHSGYAQEVSGERLCCLRTLEPPQRGPWSEQPALLPVRRRDPVSQTAAGPGTWISGWIDPKGRLETQGSLVSS